jgi:hypothetical protein
VTCVAWEGAAGEDEQSVITTGITATTTANAPHRHRDRNCRTLEHRMGRFVPPPTRDENVNGLSDH